MVGWRPGQRLLERVEGFGLAAVDVEDLREAGDLKDTQDPRAIADEPQVAVPLARAFEAADQNAEAGAVQVLYLSRIDDDPGQTLVQEVHDFLLEAGGGVDIHFAR